MRKGKKVTRQTLQSNFLDGNSNEIETFMGLIQFRLAIVIKFGQFFYLYFFRRQRSFKVKTFTNHSFDRREN